MWSATVIEKVLVGVLVCSVLPPSNEQSPYRLHRHSLRYYPWPSLAPQDFQGSRFGNAPHFLSCPDRVRRARKRGKAPWKFVQHSWCYQNASILSPITSSSPSTERGARSRGSESNAYRRVCRPGEGSAPHTRLRVHTVLKYRCSCSGVVTGGFHRDSEVALVGFSKDCDI
ncbi:hypothetical protein B0H34DRAFT_739081 [Crassisporium funariophilum]|nr:hypothetical protein B0H34DRAFT_739081 [Crassisporium funariophilum]